MVPIRAQQAAPLLFFIHNFRDIKKEIERGSLQGNYILDMKTNNDMDNSASTHMPGLTSPPRPVSTLSNT